MPARPDSTAAAAADLLGARSTAVLDVGARWGAAGAWYRLDPLAELCGFEPDAAECARINAAAGPGERFFPVALGAQAGPATLHVTREPGCSSLFEPDTALVARYPLLEVITPAGKTTVTLERLDDWARREYVERVAFLKLDTQGSELDILRGGARVLAGAIGVEVEVEFFPLYRGQALFGDVDVFARAHGFSLWRLSHLVHYSERHARELRRRDVAVFDGVTAEIAAGAGRLSWGHALYLRDYRELDPRERRADLLALAAVLDAAGETDGALGCLTHVAVAFDGVDRRRIDAERQRLTALL